MNATEVSASGSEQVLDPASQRIFAAAPSPESIGVRPLNEPSATDGEPTWVIIGIVIASIAIAVLSLLLLLLLRPCRVHRQPVVHSTTGSAKSSGKSTLTQPVDHSDAERGTPPSTAAEDSSRHGEDGAVAPTLPVEVVPRNAVDCGRPDARSPEWEVDLRSHEVIQASMHEHELSRQRIASELQVSLEQADMYMHHALGHKFPPFRDSSTSVTSGRSSRSYSMPNHGRPIDSLSAASLSAASAAAASSAAAAVANPQPESRESQRQSLPGGVYVHSNLSYATSAADPGHMHPQQPEHFVVPQPARSCGHSGVASPQWVHSAGSEASGRGFSMLPGWQEETQEQTPQRRQNMLPQPHGRPQRRRVSSNAQHAYSGSWGAVGPGSAGADVSPVHPMVVSSMPPFYPRQSAELYEGEREALRAAQLDVRRWSAGAEQARVRELVERGGLGLHGEWAGGGPTQAGGLMPQSRQKPMHQFTLQSTQRRQQERFALQHEMQYHEAQRW